MAPPDPPSMPLPSVPVVKQRVEVERKERVRPKESSERPAINPGAAINGPLRNMPQWAKEMLRDSYQEEAVRAKERAERHAKQQAEWAVKLHSKDDFWSKVCGLRYMAGGLDSLGAWKITSGSKDTSTTSWVVKGVASESSIEEWFADVLFRMAGIRTPDNLRVLYRYDPEIERIRCAAMCHTVEDQEARSKVYTIFNPGAVHVMDFVAGRGWWDGYNPEQGWGKAPTPSLEATTLKSLGRIIAMDMLINNYDRLPLVWMNEGNLANLLFVEQGVVAIDNKVNSIEHEEGLETYFKLVQQTVQQVRTQTPAPCVLEFQKFVRDSHYELDEKGLAVLQQALLDGFDYIKQELVPAKLSELVATHKKLYTSRGMDASYLNEGFLLKMLPAFA